MKQVKIFFMYGVLMTFLVHCQAQPSAKVSVDVFEQKLSATKDKIVLDVRTPDEYAEGHLADAVLIDYYGSDFKQQVSKLDKNKTVFVYCRSGGRSGSATEILHELGFKNIVDMQGGMNAWSNSGKPVIKE